MKKCDKSDYGYDNYPKSVSYIKYAIDFVSEKLMLVNGKITTKCSG